MSKQENIKTNQNTLNTNEMANSGYKLLSENRIKNSIVFDQEQNRSINRVNQHQINQAILGIEPHLFTEKIKSFENIAKASDELGQSIIKKLFSGKDIEYKKDPDLLEDIKNTIKSFSSLTQLSIMHSSGIKDTGHSI